MCEINMPKLSISYFKAYKFHEIYAETKPRGNFEVERGEALYYFFLRGHTENSLSYHSCTKKGQIVRSALVSVNFFCLRCDPCQW